MIVSVELVEITIAGGVQQSSASMTKGQVAENCVPFYNEGYNYYLNTDIHATNIDIWFSGNTVYVERGYDNLYGISNRDTIVYIHIVEFSPSSVRVQQGTFGFSSPDASGTASIDTVNLSNAAILFTQNMVQISNYYYCREGHINGYFSANNELTFEVNNIGNTFSGHYYVIEALNNEFSVQHLSSWDWPSNTTITQTRTISEVDTTKTFIISSHKTNSPFPNSGFMGAYLSDSTHVGLERGFGSSSYRPLDVRTQVIEFSSADAFVEHGSLTWAGTDTQKQLALTHGFDDTKSIIWNPSRGGFPSGKSNGNGNYYHYSWAKYDFVNENLLQGDRIIAGVNITTTHRLQTIEFTITPANQAILDGLSFRGAKIR